MKQKITWRETWKIYRYHYAQACIWGTLFLIFLGIPTFFICKHYDINLIDVMKKPIIALPVLAILFFIQMFPINLFVLKYKTFNKNFNGFKLQLKSDEKDST